MVKFVHFNVSAELITVCPELFVKDVVTLLLIKNS